MRVPCVNVPTSLQFGHGCDAVEMSTISRPWLTISPLQFGHGCDAVEMLKRMEILYS